MIRLEYTGFTDLCQNCPYIGRNICATIGQGLHNSYSVLRLGTGRNKYTIQLKLFQKDDELFQFETEDNCIISWRDRSKYEDRDEISNFEFQAFGNFSFGGRQWIYSCDYADDTVLDIRGIRLKVIKIVFELDDACTKPITGISNDIICYDEIIKVRYACIGKLSALLKVSGESFERSSKLSKSEGIKNLPEITFQEFLDADIGTRFVFQNIQSDAWWLVKKINVLNVEEDYPVKIATCVLYLDDFASECTATLTYNDAWAEKDNITFEACLKNKFWTDTIEEDIWISLAN